VCMYVDVSCMCACVYVCVCCSCVCMWTCRVYVCVYVDVSCICVCVRVCPRVRVWDVGMWLPPADHLTV